MYSPRELIRIDLSRQKISKEVIPPELYRKFIGGEGINAWLLWEHFLKIDPRMDPLSQDNVLIFGVGPLAATGLGAGSKSRFTFKSPAYNLYGDTSVGGGFGSQLRWAGYDHIVITGKAKHPVYIWVNDDSVEIRDARHLWGNDVETTDKLIKEELRDEQVETAGIGQAGENLVRFASIMVSCDQAAARGGGGCVFGSKNLKAIAARGTKGLPISNPDGLLECIKEFREYKERDPGAKIHLKYGTICTIKEWNPVGALAYRNQQVGLVPEDNINRIDHNWYANNIGVRTNTCSPGCAFACGGRYHLKGNESPGARRHAGERGTKPEFGSINSFANACDLSDLPEVSHLNRMCNEYGMDAFETGMGIAFLMELWERGIISQEDTRKWTGEPLSFEWGNYEAMERIIDAIGLHKNKLGELLSGGVYKAALKIEEMKNVPALKYAMYGKAGAAHELSGKLPSLGLYMATCPFGAHNIGISTAMSEKFLGAPDAGRPDTSPGQGGFPYKLKGAGHAVGEYFAAIANSLGVCRILCAYGSMREMPLEVLGKALSAVTRVKLTPEEFVTAGERVVNIEKAFNSRLGLRRQDDSVCHRWMNEPLLEGLAKGLKLGDFLEPLKDEYYEYHGWDKETSLQTGKKLEELGMRDVAQVLANEGALSFAVAKG